MKLDRDTPRTSRVFQGVAETMLLQFAEIQSQIPHAGERGEQRELQLRRFLELYLPKKYSVGTGHILNAKDEISRQCDLVIYDAFNCPPLFVEDGYQFFPVEAVLGVIEVKSVLDSKALGECVENIRSVKALQGAYQILGCVFAYQSTFGPKPSIRGTADRLHRLNAETVSGQHIDLLTILDDGLLYSWPLTKDQEDEYVVFVELALPNLAYFLYLLLGMLAQRIPSMPDLVKYVSKTLELGLCMTYPISASEIT